MKNRGATKKWEDRFPTARDKSFDYIRSTTNDSFTKKYRNIVRIKKDGSYEIEIPNKLKLSQIYKFLTDVLCDMNFLLMQDDIKIREWNKFQARYKQQQKELTELKEKFNSLKEDEKDYQQHIEAIDDYLDKLGLDFDDYEATQTNQSVTNKGIEI